MSQYGSSWIDRMRAAYDDSPFMRSGFLTSLVLCGVLAASFGLYYEHMQGNFHRVRTVEVVADQPTAQRLGGLDVVSLARSPMNSSSSPEFISTTLAPGLGMEVLQATISVPSLGTIPLLASTGGGPEGALSESTVAAPIVVNVSRKDGTHWTEAVNLLNHRTADHESSSTMPDGGAADASFQGTSVTGQGDDSGVETRVSVILGGRALELAVVAKNFSDQPRAVTMSWEPRFLLGAKGMTLIQPRLEESDGPVTPAPISLDQHPVHSTYTHFKHSFLSDGPSIELRDNSGLYSLVMTAISGGLRSLRAETTQGGKSVLLAFSTASGEPGPNSATILQPGESLQFRLRLQVTPASTSSLK